MQPHRTAQPVTAILLPFVFYNSCLEVVIKNIRPQSELPVGTQI
jgi:hypothetical protein